MPQIHVEKLSLQQIADDEDLDIVEVTPRNGDSDDLTFVPDVSNGMATNNTHFISPEITPPQPSSTRHEKEKAGEAPNMMTSLLSNIGKVWAGPRVEERPDVKSDFLEGSPASIVSSKSSHTSPRSSSTTRNEDELTDRDKRVFTVIDGADARDFQEFLDDDGGANVCIPVLCLVEFGVRGSYASDLWVLFHNSIRRELFDIFEILGILRQEYLSLTFDDIYHIRKWWRFYVLLWTHYVYYEKTHLDPLIHQICHVDGRGDVLKKRLTPILETREWLALKMEEITSYVEEFESLPPGRALSLFCKTVESYSNRVIVYFVGQERLLPPFIENYHNEDIKLSLESKLIERLRESDHFPELLVALCRWIGTVPGTPRSKSQTKDREKWLNHHLSWYERRNFVKFYHRYQECHGSIVSYLQNRLSHADSL